MDTPTHTQPHRIRQFHIRLSDEERTRMQERAKEAGFPLSGFVRECGINGRVCPVPSINREQWSVLAATTANLNQLVRLCHKGTVPRHLDAVLLETSRLLHEVRTQLIKGN